MYTSTRNKTTITASKAILNGLAPDGGLYVLQNINSAFFSENLRGLTYNELAKKILSEFLDDYPKGVIADIVDASYKDNFVPDIVGLKHFDSFSLLELFKGETFAFKDMALSILPSLFDAAKRINKINAKTIILTATSGDTGSAALSGFGKIDNTYVIVLYPKHGISEFQALQMTKYESDNCYVLGIDGNFDDCQSIVKKLFLGTKVKNAILSSANSINIGRIIPQVVYYFYTYLKLVEDKKINFYNKVNFTVPTGNFGNIYAAYIAKEMGLPIHKLIIASNANNVLTELFDSFDYDIDRSLLKTISPSMDILVSSNFERYLYNLSLNTDQINQYMRALRDNKMIYIKELKHQQTFKAYYASEENTKQAIKSFYKDYKYVIDPHTAVGFYCNQKYRSKHVDKAYNVILSTASAYKFSGSVLNALDLKPSKDLNAQIKQLKTINEENYDSRLESFLDAKLNTNVIPLEGAYDYVAKVIGEIDDKD